MTKERAQEIIRQQSQWPYWGNYSRFMTADEKAEIQTLWEACPHGGSSFASTLHKVAAQ